MIKKKIISRLRPDLPFAVASSLQGTQNAMDGSASLPIRSATYKPDSDVHSKANASFNSPAISFFLVILAFFIHPYFLIIIAAGIQLYVRVNARGFFSICSLSLAIFWSSRNLFVGDDVVGYVMDFNSMQLASISSLAKVFFVNPSGNELLYRLYVYFISIFTSDEKIFIFIMYFTIAALTSVLCVLVTRRYSIVMMALLFFGIGGFIDQAALHLWRSTLGGLLFIISAVLYSKNRPMAILLLLCSILVHISLVIFIPFLIYINYFKSRRKVFISVILSLILTIVIAYYLGFFNSLSQGRLSVYFIASGSSIDLISIYICVVILIYIFLNKSNIENLPATSIMTLSFMAWCGVLYPNASMFYGRYFYSLLPFITLLSLDIVMRVKYKPVIFFILFILFIMKIAAFQNSVFYKEGFGDVSFFFSGPFSMLLQ